LSCEPNAIDGSIIQISNNHSDIGFMDSNWLSTQHWFNRCSGLWESNDYHFWNWYRFWFGFHNPTFLSHTNHENMCVVSWIPIAMRRPRTNWALTWLCHNDEGYPMTNNSWVTYGLFPTFCGALQTNQFGVTWEPWLTLRLQKKLYNYNYSTSIITGFFYVICTSMCIQSVESNVSV
jgi:hypothetical protein